MFSAVKHMFSLNMFGDEVWTQLFVTWVNNLGRKIFSSHTARALENFPPLL